VPEPESCRSLCIDKYEAFSQRGAPHVGVTAVPPWFLSPADHLSISCLSPVDPLCVSPPITPCDDQQGIIAPEGARPY
jgi:hypothetical protein